MQISQRLAQLSRINTPQRFSKTFAMLALKAKIGQLSTDI